MKLTDFFRNLFSNEKDLQDFSDLQEKLMEYCGQTFQNIDLLNQAFLHSSAINIDEQTRDSSYERLEFLGDAVLELIVSQFLYENFPDYSEGKLTQIRAQLVNRTTLAHTSKSLNFGKYLKLGRGGEKDNLRSLHSILSDIYESFIGALYLSNGFDCAYKFIHATLLIKHHTLIPAEDTQNYKGLLYEYCQKRGISDPDFVVTAENGPDHGKNFTITVYIEDIPYGEGEGKSKKEASQSAAKEALNKLDVHY